MSDRQFTMSPPRSPCTITTKLSVASALLLALLLTFGLSQMPYHPTFAEAARLRTATHTTQHSDSTPPTRRKAVCLVYDKPPRTGSTTIAWALEACWSSTLKFEHHFFERDAENKRVSAEVASPLSKMLQYSSRFVASIHRHLVFDDSEIDALRSGCDQLFFVTNTRPLPERLASAAKAEATLRTSGKNQNVTLSGDMLARALADIRGRKSRRRAASYHKRPFKGSKRLDADFVIRSESLIADTEMLMRAFGCRGDATSTNHHTADDVATEVPESEKVYVDGGSTELTAKFLTEEAFRLFPKDEQYDFYMKEANRVNRKGLVRAAQLAQLRMDAMNAPLPGPIAD